MRQKKHSDLRTVVVMMLITLLGKILGAVRDMFHGAVYGTEDIAGNAFMLASLIPRYFLDIMFAAVFSASFIPVFNEYLTTKGKEQAESLASKFVSIIIMLTTLVTVVCIIFSGELFGFMTINANPEVQAVGTELLRIMFPTLIISGIAFSLTGILQSMGEFNIPAAMSLVSNSIIIIYYWFFIDRFGVYGLCVAFILGWVSQVLVQIPFFFKNHFKLRFTIDFNEPGIREIARLVLPVMVSTWAAPVNFMVNLMAVSHLYGGSGQGSSVLNYANNLYAIITGVFILSVSNLIFPKLSKLNTLSDMSQFGETLLNTMRSLLFFLIPMALGLMVMSQPLVKLFYERAMFTESSTSLTATALFYFSIGIPGYGLLTVLNRAFFSMKDGFTPLLTGIISIIINVVLSFALVERMEIGGPALASAVSLSATSVIMLILMYRKNKHILNIKCLTDTLKMLIAGSLMTICVVFVRNQLQASLSDSMIEKVGILVIPVLTGTVIYLAGTAILRVKESLIAFELVGNAFRGLSNDKNKK